MPNLKRISTLLEGSFRCIADHQRINALMSRTLPDGLYETLLDEELKAVITLHPELRSIFGKLELEEQPSRYAAFLAQVIEKALALEPNPQLRLAVCNEIIDRLSGNARNAHLKQKRLVASDKQILLEVTPPHRAIAGIPRPMTSMVESSLFTGSPREPQLSHELVKEMASADSLDMLISFIKWSGLRLLAKGLEELTQRGGHVRIITTSYMGASDANAVEWLAKLPNTAVRVSYDSERTRLHAKAYHFTRRSGLPTAYIGSANMSHAAMTSGLEWNLKITAQDMPHIVEKFSAEFETYWNSQEFNELNPDEPHELRQAIARARNLGVQVPTVLFDLHPHPYQERILDDLQAERQVRNLWRNLIVAATGTGKTVVAAFDYKRHFEKSKRDFRLLFVAHRQEILHQALVTFRAVLRTPDFGELLVGTHEPTRREHLFCSVEMLQSRRLWDQVGADFYDYIVIDEVHHAPANSYRPIFERFQPKILLGLTATPERMDGSSVVADFGYRFSSEIRLPEALEQKLLCPFQYFGIADVVSLSSDRFWKNGRYSIEELENVYTGAHAVAKQRVEAIIGALTRLEPDLSMVKGIGFCVSIRHAEFMAGEFNNRGIPSAVLVGETPELQRRKHLEDLKRGQLRFLFTRDVLNEGLDVPQINTVLFLRPTESVTVFLQQLGRGLRHYPGKDCLTVLDFVGQAHKKYRIDRKLRALLPQKRYHIDREVQLDFPHLPPGCSIQLDRVSREYVLENIRENLQNLADQVREQIETFEEESGLRLSFSNFIRHHEHDPLALLSKDSWAGWCARALRTVPPSDPDQVRLHPGLLRVAQVSGPEELRRIKTFAEHLIAHDIGSAMNVVRDSAAGMHYRFWGKPLPALGFTSFDEAFLQLEKNQAFLSDVLEIAEWSESETRVGAEAAPLPFPCLLELHAQYSADDVKAALGLATGATAGIRGVGLMQNAVRKVYVVLVTFQKNERDFSPTTMYADYPISRELMHWESPATTSQSSNTGTNLIHHVERGYSVLFFVRNTKRENGRSVPYTYLGPGSLVEHSGERPIAMVWRLDHLMPAQVLEENRRGG